MLICGRGILWCYFHVHAGFDCWFHSGCMHCGHIHYPFCKVDDFENNFPADFVSKGLDQTRGWLDLLTYSWDETVVLITNRR